MHDDTFRDDDSPGFLLNQVTLQLNAALDRALAPYGVTGAQWTALWLLATGRARVPSAISAYIGVDSGATTRLLDRMAEKGLIERRPCPTDRRSVEIALTPQARALYPQLPDRVEAVVDTLLADVPVEEVALLRRTLLRMLANAERLRGGRRRFARATGETGETSCADAAQSGERVTGDNT